MALTFPAAPSDTSNYMLGYGPKSHNVYYLGEPVTMLLFQDNGDESVQFWNYRQPPTGWTCYDIDGNSWSGTPTYTASDQQDYLGQYYRKFTITPPPGKSVFPCGWYRVELTGSYNNPDMPNGEGGESTFLVVNDDSHFIDPPNWATYHWEQGSDEILNGLVSIGPYRYSIHDIDNPTAEINGIINNAAGPVNTYWLNTAAPNRPRKAYVDFPNGSVDAVSVYANAVGGPGALGSPSSLSVVTMVPDPSWVEIANGTQAGTKKVIIYQPQGTVVETYDNLTTWWNVMDAINNNSPRLRAWSSTLSETAKNVGPVQIITTRFNNVTSTVQALYPLGFTVYGGPWNEPENAEGGFVATQARAFKAAVKLGNSNALVMGPNAVSFNTGVLAWIDYHLSQLPANFYDIIGVHGYNTTNGDMMLADKMLTNFRQMLQTRGYGSTPVWMTEAGFFVSVVGVQHWRRAAHWIALWYLMYEAYGIPREHICYYYPTQHGFWGFPTHAATNKYKVYLTSAMCMFWRGFAERTYNSLFQSRLVFPGASADLFFGSVYLESGVSKTVALLNTGMPAGTVTLAVTGASTVDVYDYAGNKMTQAVIAGKVTVATADLPTYVVMAPSATVSVSDANRGLDKVGQNLVQASSKSYQETINYKDTSMSSGAFNLIANNTVDADYTMDSSDDIRPYRSKGPFPQEIKFNWPSNQRVSRAVVFFAPPWQYRGTPKRFRIDTWNGSAWVTQYSHNDTSMTSKPWVSPWIWGGMRETYWKEQWIWDIPLTTPVSTLAVRLVIEEAGFGGEPDAISKTGMGQGWDEGVTIREIRIY